jgi:protein arginine phosphatase
MEKTRLRNILFVCTGNTCRSALAEHLFRKRLADAGRTDVSVKSAGVGAYPGMPSPPEVVKILKRSGVEDARHAAQILSGELVDWADVILAMEEGHRLAIGRKFPRAAGKVHLFKTYAGAPGLPDIPDPIGSSQDVYDACADDLNAALDRLLQKLE